MKNLDTNKKIAAIIQARMNSTRLPGKVLKKILGRPMLGYLLERVSKSKYLNQIIIATSVREDDKKIVEFAKQFGVTTFTGSETDVLDRYLKAAEKNSVDIIIRIGADSPLEDPEIIDMVIERHLLSQADCTHNLCLYGSNMPDGVDLEVINFTALQKSWECGTSPHHREHVDEYIYEHPEIFKIETVSGPEWLNRPNYRLTVDYQEDFELVTEILQNFHPEQPSARQIIQFLDKNPALVQINSPFALKNKYPI